MMPTGRAAPKNIDEYIAWFPPDVQVILERISLTIRQAAPDAQEIISYKIPASYFIPTSESCYLSDARLDRYFNFDRDACTCTRHSDTARPDRLSEYFSIR